MKKVLSFGQKLLQYNQSPFNSVTFIFHRTTATFFDDKLAQTLHHACWLGVHVSRVFENFQASFGAVGQIWLLQVDYLSKIKGSVIYLAFTNFNKHSFSY